MSDDQEWLAQPVDNLGGWLTTVLSRVAIDMLRSGKLRDRSFFDDVVDSGQHPAGGLDPAEQAAAADSVGAALLVVLGTLAPAERLAFVLHESFDVPYAEIATILGRSPAATKQLARRARTKVRGSRSMDPDPARQRAIVTAFLAASRDGDLAGLVSTLDPGVRMDADPRAVTMGADAVVQGADAVAGAFCGRALGAQPAMIDGGAGIAWRVDGRLRVVWELFIEHGRIAHIDMLADPDTLAHLEVTFL